MNMLKITLRQLLTLLSLFVLSSPTLAVANEVVLDDRVAVTSADNLQPGLASHYYLKFKARSLGELPLGSNTELEHFSGPPISQLNHEFGKDEVFASGTSRTVGLRLAGFLHLPQMGEYQFQTLSNDGVEVKIGGLLLIDDGQQHSDQWSEKARLLVSKPGWYPVEVAYFQRKGTATIKLYWQQPGGSEWQPVPATAYWHRPGQLDE